MADRQAIENMLASWAYGYDEREPERMRAAFTEDAVMTMEIGLGDDKELMGPYTGIEEVMGLFTDHHGEQRDQRRHVTTNLVVLDETEDTASIVSYLSLFVTAGGEVRLQATGVYRDQVVRLDGAWRIRERLLQLDVHY